MQRWLPAYVGLGSNLDDPRARVLEAIDRLARLPRSCCLRASRLYASKPLDGSAQPDYVNVVVGLLTQLTPEELFAELQRIESAMGRPARHERWGPRVIDLDLLSMGSERRTGEPLTLPHPGVVERNFVLYPLAEIAPDADLPGLGRVAALAGRARFEGLTLLQHP